MFDFLRNWTKSAEEKRQEALNAYLDDALTPKERRQFEQLLAQDSALRLEVEQRRALKEQMRQLPRRRVPRNFTLDPAVYGRPQRQPLFQLYPAMRTAAVLTAFFFILAVAADFYLGGQSAPAFSGAAQDVALMEEVEVVEVTRVVTETVLEEGAVVEVTRVVETEVVVEEMEMAAPAAAEAVEEPAAEEPVAEEAPAEEMAAGEPEMEEFAAEAPPPSATASPEAANAAEAPTAADAGESAVEAESTATAVPTSSPAPTVSAPTAVDATKSTVPRPATQTIVPERAVTAVPTIQAADTLADDMDEEMETVTSPAPKPERAPISGLRWLQISLGALFVVLTLAVLYVRRQS